MKRMINLRRLEFAVTYNCSSQCIHCFIDEEKKKKYPGHIGKEGARIVKDVAELYELESVMTFGGESLLYPEDTCAIHQTAAELGIPIRQIITNGLWTKDSDRMREIAAMVVDSGVNELLISIDVFHASYVSINILTEVAQVFLDLGLEKIKWNPCWVKSYSDDNKYNLETKKLLENVKYLGLSMGKGNVISPDGAAVKNLTEFMPAKIIYPTGECSDQPYTYNLDNLKSICIEPNGDISICPSFIMGNALAEDIKELLLNYDPYQVREMRCVLEKGMKGLLELAEQAGIQLDSTGYYTICDMCKEIVNKLN